MNIDVITLVTMAVFTAAVWGYVLLYKSKPIQRVNIAALVTIHAIVAARMWFLWPDEINLTLVLALDFLALYHIKLKGQWKRFDKFVQSYAGFLAGLINIILLRVLGRHTGWHIQELVYYWIFIVLQALAMSGVLKIVVWKRTAIAHA